MKKTHIFVPKTDNMVEIISQRFVYANIIPHKNYCKLSERYEDKYVDEDIKDIANDDEFQINVVKYKRPIVSKVLFNKAKGKKRTKYFHNDDNNGDNNYVYIRHACKDEPIFRTTKDRHIKRHMGNPFSSISIRIIERSVRINGDKVTFKQFTHEKTRQINWKYFRKKTFVNSITINTKTGELVVCRTSNAGTSKTISFTKNSFFSVHKSISLMLYMEDTQKTKLNFELRKNLNNDEFINAIYSAIGIEKNNQSTLTTRTESLTGDIMKFFIKMKNIKVPNEYYRLLKYYYPTEKFLKKNDRKLVASVLDKLNIKSKITIKLIHEYPLLDPGNLKTLCGIMGDKYSKYIGSISDKFFIRSRSNETEYKDGHVNNIPKNITDNDRENIIRIFNDIEKDNIAVRFDNEFLTLFIDHFGMMDKLKRYIPEIKLNARTYNDFTVEHMEYSDAVTALSKVWMIEYVFNEKMVRGIEDPIFSKTNVRNDNGEFIINQIVPHILKKDSEYVEEGNHMHHCVGTYSDREKSVIISLRNPETLKRITCEFNVQDGRCIQARSYCNQTPPVEFNEALEIVKDKAALYARLGIFGSLEKRKTKLEINGIPVDENDVTNLFGEEMPEVF